MTSPSGVRRFTVTETREAMEVRADNLDEVAEWCGGEVQRYRSIEPERFPDRCGIEYVAGSDCGWVEIGDVLVSDGTRWWDVPREEFEKDSEQWTEETP